MSYEIRLTKRAKKHLDKLGKDTRDRINSAFKNLVAYYNGESVSIPDLKMLQGKYNGLLRLRVGDLRVIFRMEMDSLAILIIDIVPRGNAYKD